MELDLKIGDFVECHWMSGNKYIARFLGIDLEHNFKYKYKVRWIAGTKSMSNMNCDLIYYLGEHEIDKIVPISEVVMEQL